MSDFPHEISFETLEKTPDGSGGYENKWVAFKEECAAFVQPLTGSSRYYAQQIDTSIDYKIFTEYDEELMDQKKKIRINHDGKIFEIKYPIDQGGLNEIICLYCKGD